MHIHAQTSDLYVYMCCTHNNLVTASSSSSSSPPPPQNWQGWSKQRLTELCWQHVAGRGVFPAQWQWRSSCQDEPPLHSRHIVNNSWQATSQDDISDCHSLLTWWTCNSTGSVLSLWEDSLKVQCCEKHTKPLIFIDNWQDGQLHTVHANSWQKVRHIHIPKLMFFTHITDTRRHDSQLT